MEDANKILPQLYGERERLGMQSERCKSVAAAAGQGAVSVEGEGALEQPGRLGQVPRLVGQVLRPALRKLDVRRRRAA